jgi:hypothetical protein
MLWPKFRLSLGNIFLMSVLLGVNVLLSTELDIPGLAVYKTYFCWYFLQSATLRLFHYSLHIFCTSPMPYTLLSPPYQWLLSHFCPVLFRSWKMCLRIHTINTVGLIATHVCLCTLWDVLPLSCVHIFCRSMLASSPQVSSSLFSIFSSIPIGLSLFKEWEFLISGWDLLLT